MTADHATNGRPKPDAVSVEGVVTEALPRALYRVAVEGRRQVLAHAAHGPHQNFVRILVGDRVIVELSAVDRGRGRIVRRFESGRS